LPGASASPAPGFAFLDGKKPDKEKSFPEEDDPTVGAPGVLLFHTLNLIDSITTCLPCQKIEIRREKQLVFF